MAEEITTPEARPQAVDVTAGEGDGTGSEVANLKDVLGEVLGKEFKSDEDAVAYVKSNESFTGKWKNYKNLIEPLEQRLGSQSAVNKLLSDLQMTQEQPKPQEQAPPTPAPTAQPEAPKPDGDFVSKAQYETDKFFNEHPDYVPHRDLITSLSKAEKKTLSETVELPAFKNIFEKARKGDEFEKSRSVLHTNPRLGASADKISKAREAVKSGDDQQARSLAVDAVLDISERK